MIAIFKNSFKCTCYFLSRGSWRILWKWTQQSQTLTDWGQQTQAEIQGGRTRQDLLRTTSEESFPSKKTLCTCTNTVVKSKRSPNKHCSVFNLEWLLVLVCSYPTVSLAVCTLPRYLKEHKKEMERERMVKAKEAADECPEGHILLPDEIRQKHLSTLRDSKLYVFTNKNYLL